MVRLLNWLVGLGLAAALAASAAPTECPQHYPAGQAPEITNPRLAVGTRELCYSEFGVLHSGVTRTPLWSAEHLTAEEMVQADRIRRKNAFHPEPRLPRRERAELRDYARSGYDQGHMAPAGDMPTEQAQYESFSLANIVPQHPRNNQRLWARIEEAVRVLAREKGELYVVTGPLFLGERLQQIGGRVLVPTHVYKLVYEPKQGRAAAYLAENQPGDEYRVVGLPELEQLAGIDFLPWLSAADKAQLLELPAPRQR
ncbi:MAG: DNA/RNA non-specific endonuclease [Xanthomonadaceae bacterium]|nr:DNA/RNA non-specific endonuclease [Xanthomonadaceae bacterium]